MKASLRYERYRGLSVHYRVTGKFSKIPPLKIKREKGRRKTSEADGFA
jgi:hypothetical protein